MRLRMQVESDIHHAKNRKIKGLEGFISQKDTNYATKIGANQNRLF